MDVMGEVRIWCVDMTGEPGGRKEKGPFSQAEGQFPARESTSYAMPWSSGLKKAKSELSTQLKELRTTSRNAPSKLLQTPGPSSAKYYKVEGYTLNLVAIND